MLKSRIKKLVDLKSALNSSIIAFLLLFVFMFAPDTGDFKHALFPLAAVLAFIFTILGILVIYHTIKRKIRGKLRVFLLLSGIGAGSFLILTILHNFFYALGIVFEESAVLSFLMEGLSVTAFLLGILGAPLAYIVGTIGAKVIFFKNS